MKNTPIRSGSRLIFLSVGSMILGVLFIDIYGIIIKFLGDSYSTNQVVLFRNLFAIIPLLTLIFYTNENLNIFKKITKKFIILCSIRGLCFLFMNVFYFIAINNMDFATASTLTFSATFFIVILSIFFLNDKVGIYRWSAVIIGFIGVAMIMKPTNDIFSYYSVYPLMVGFLYSIAIIILKFIPDYNSTAKIQFYSLISSIIGAVILLTITFDNIVIKSFNDLLMLISIGILGGSAGILFIYAYRLIEASKLAVFEYLAIPSSFFLGWFFFDEFPIDQLFPGVLGIVLAGMIIIWRDKKKKRTLKVSKKIY
tara:strand:+ start:792 stop:1724 length:933 start_codon:yes stop_codon:yes gene_type:complete